MLLLRVPPPINSHLGAKEHYLVTEDISFPI